MQKTSKLYCCLDSDPRLKRNVLFVTAPHFLGCFPDTSLYVQKQELSVSEEKGQR